jgi:hypothetical protein
MKIKSHVRHELREIDRITSQLTDVGPFRLLGIVADTATIPGNNRLRCCFVGRTFVYKNYHN